MLISNNYPQVNHRYVNFTSLKVPYNAEENLQKLPKATLQKVYRFGRYLQDTNHVDMQLENDLTPFIQSKLQKEGGIFPPFKFLKPDADSPIFKIIAKYKGAIPYGKKVNGNTVELSIETRNNKVAQNLYNRFNTARGDIEKSGLLTKIIDNTLDEPNIKAKNLAEQNLTKGQIIDNIMGEFGVWDA